MIIANLYTDNIKSYAEKSSEVCNWYCQLYGYKHELRKNIIDASRPAAWSKILLLRELMTQSNEGDWLWWIDSDAIITNFDIDASSITAKASANQFMIISKNPHVINSGSFFIKSCKESMAFLSEVYDRVECINHSWWEQQAMIKVLNGNKYDDKILYLNQREFNCMPDIWANGDFLIHMPGKFKNLRQGTIDRWHKIHKESLLDYKKRRTAKTIK